MNNEFGRYCEPPRLNLHGVNKFVADLQNTEGYRKRPDLHEYFEKCVIPNLSCPSLDEDKAYAIIEGIWAAVRRRVGEVDSDAQSN